MRQEAPDPVILFDLVKQMVYRPGWRFILKDMVRDVDPKTREALTRGLTLDVVTMGYDSYHPERGEDYSVHHYRIVPAATYNEQSWTRWLFDQCSIVDDHEAMEFFGLKQYVEGQLTDEIVRPYAPLHGPGNDPYYVREASTDLDRRTRFTGNVVCQHCGKETAS